jgi:very-short-patch-repair endonuclease
MRVPDGVRGIAEMQENVVSRRQMLDVGVSRNLIEERLKRGDWRQIYRGVYALFTGPVSREARLWAAVLRAGPGALLSHETAAELHGLIERSDAIHVSIPSSRRIEAKGIVVHISPRTEDASWPRFRPWRTNIEETVLDLVQEARTFDDVCGWITKAFGRRLTTEYFLGAAARQRKKMRWRAALEEIIAAGDKVHSPLEFRYLRDVERAHGLPTAKRQVQVRIDGKKAYRDVYYEEFHVVVELDGERAHPPQQGAQDAHRDAVTSAEGIETVRYRWRHVRGNPCETAVLQARILRQHGWTGVPTPCSGDCYVSRAFPQAA